MWFIITFHCVFAESCAATTRNSDTCIAKLLTNSQYETVKLQSFVVYLCSKEGAKFQKFQLGILIGCRDILPTQKSMKTTTESFHIEW